ncbi:hypothetical protein PRBRB14_01780 [Hallella multisaccharivorax DSM 17128]|uniref:Anti-FecI sigma factor, FecR n=1 Tax=Hallella multisaccharivorax DSM 17128 TaxID=688246 RepID=F8NAK0_9BACT|nr:FecR domain-containing protein [Hallella multisaccharivorax]EGN55800.1 anti-FecI sigma factor, FecR [Hallella multisaccharivorax DSM 17128]GJG29299.1 hypothetical protein PRBRB14_01780 [Hallella multisaccharivorax DSM 17128]
MKSSDYDKINSSMDFFRLKDRKFIMWRLLRTQELDDFWNDFIVRHPELEAEFDEAVRISDSLQINDAHYAGTDVLLERIQKTLSAKQRHVRILHISRIAAVAAMFLLLFVPALYFGYVHYIKQPAGQNYALLSKGNGVNTEELLREMRKSKNVELLVDGKRLTFRHLGEMTITDGKVIYGKSGSVSGKTCRLHVPAGKRFAITLADGTKLWVNSRSEAEVPTKFTGRTRDVNVDGEVFADVMKNPQQPFIIHTSRMDVTVKGTSFDVSAYSREREAAVVLVRGKVQVDTRRDGSMTVLPSERVSLANGRLSKRTVDVSDYVSWKDNYLFFNDTPVSEVLKKVSSYYDIRFTEVDPILNDKKVSGKLNLSDNVDDILSSIALLTSSAYTREKDMVKLVRKGRK